MNYVEQMHIVSKDTHIICMIFSCCHVIEFVGIEGALRTEKYYVCSPFHFQLTVKA